ncbi:hypothetical protein AAFO90_24170 [Phaeobacter sp. CAU 1743]|uniref:hypothetical protein n=1 Tax=Phaeobacter sp. CAU 1743 TaxID=3140367 RepID=UPI00325C19D2
MTRLERGILQGAFTLCLMLPACQKAFDYDAASPSSRLAPAEVYQVEVDTSVDPLTEAASKMRDRQFVHAVAYYKAALAQDPGSESAIFPTSTAKRVSD